MGNYTHVIEQDKVYLLIINSRLKVCRLLLKGMVINMKILIVDDEVLTRNGLQANIDWKSLQIKEVLEADDGQSALEMAKKHKPEIVLTDIRMPRMDGVTLAAKLRELFPNTSIIFMSGYSDKEYLKAAIKLKATSYVEKPINNKEVESAIEEAIKTHNLLEQNKYTKTIQQNTRSSQLALMLTRPLNLEDMNYQANVNALMVEFQPSTYFVTILVKLNQMVSVVGEERIEELFDKLKNYSKIKKISLLYAVKNESFIVLNLFSNTKLLESAVLDYVRYVKECMDKICPFFIAIGNAVNGPERAYESYNNAVLLIQGSFFYPYNSILNRLDRADHNLSYIEEQTDKFRQAITEQEFDLAKHSVNDLYRHLKSGNTLLPSQVKDLYYKLFSAIENVYVSLMITQQEGLSTIWDIISESQILDELNALLLEKMEELIQAINNRQPENPIIFMMKEFIHKNYFMDSLSVKNISEYIHLSTAYACTLFKNETNQTLNQYLTDFRIEKAKQLLADPRNKISDISSKVGYTDGNYFAKSFKKSVGLSPSEYREKMLV